MDKGDLFEGKYRIIDILGHGGMSTVYLAQNIKLGTLWAVKEISKKASSKIDIYIEPNILKRLSHPALPRIFDIIEDDDNIYVIVDYIEGRSLDKELAAVASFPEETVIEWAIQLCGVLQYLHTFKPNPIIYRDMKPSNIILTKDGNIKLIDFGIAREFKEELGSDTIYIGTRGYAAPEQYGFGQTNVMTDIYSLGITLFQLLTGKNPNVPPYEIKPVSYYNKNLSMHIVHIINKCTRQNPGERYQSVQELLTKLKSIGEAAKADSYYNENKGDRNNDFATSKNETSDRIINFKKLVLTVWGNAEFACEFAYTAAKLTNFNVLLLNLDFIAPKVDYYLNISENCNYKGTIDVFDKILDYAKQNKLTREELKYECFKKNELSNLHILYSNYDIKNYGKYKVEDIEKLIDAAYKNYEITILIANKSIFDIYTIKALEKSDFNLIPLIPNIDSIREFNNYVAFMNERHSIPEDKYRVIAFEYKQNISPSLDDIKEEICGDFVGCITYNPKREIYRNLKAVFSKRLYGRELNEYIDILSKFNIVPKKGLIEKIAYYFKTSVRKMKRNTRKLKLKFIKAV